MEKNLFVPDELAMNNLGMKLAQASNLIPKGLVVYLSGELGTGKTTLVRGFLRGLGYENKIKSPTYTLVETYNLNEKIIYHFDLYRITDPAELELIGIRDYDQKEAVIFIEWPERADFLLPKADLKCNIVLQNNGRQVTIKGLSKRGNFVLQKI